MDGVIVDSEPLHEKAFQVVFIKNGLKEVNYEKYKSISILYPIDYQ